MVAKGETVGYSATWTAPQDSLIATVQGGYADGIIRALSGRATLWAGDVPCPVVGRVSMDMITVDVSHLTHVPDALDLIGPHHTLDHLAQVAGTIGYEILTRLAARLDRRFIGTLG